MKINNQKIWKGIKSLFAVDKPARNMIIIIALLLTTAVIKIGFIASEEITGESMFQTWVWACLIVILVMISVVAIFYLEKLFCLAGGILMLMVSFSVEFYRPDIAIYITLIALFGYVGYVLGEEIFIKRLKGGKKSKCHQ